MPGAQFTRRAPERAVRRRLAVLRQPLGHACASHTSAQQWPLALGSEEDYGPVPFSTTTLTQTAGGRHRLPDARRRTARHGCAGRDAAERAHAPVPCSAVALDACPTTTTTLFDSRAPAAEPLAVVPATPPTWATPLSTAGAPRGLLSPDGTVRLIDPGPPGRRGRRHPGQHAPARRRPAATGGRRPGRCWTPRAAWRSASTARCSSPTRAASRAPHRPGRDDHDGGGQRPGVRGAHGCVR